MDVLRPDPTQRPIRLTRRRGAHRRHPRSLLAGAALLLALAIPAIAEAQLPPNNGGVDQYVAPVPDARGDRPANPNHPGPGGGGGGSSQLPPGVRGSLPAGGEGVLLGRIATDPGSGAPTDGDGDGDRDHGGSSGGSGGGGTGGDDSGGGGGVPEEKDVTAASAITSSISDDPAVAVVVAAVFGLTLALAAIGLARRRRGT